MGLFGRQDGVLDAGEDSGFEIGRRLIVGYRVLEGPGHRLELGYCSLAALTRGQVLTEGVGVGRVQGVKDPPGDFGMSEVRMGVIRGH
jgi:hypothetical protein